jgi:hypothetical protein
MHENANLEPRPDQPKPRIFAGSRLPAHAARLDREFHAWFRLGLSGLDASTLAARFSAIGSRQVSSRPYLLMYINKTVRFFGRIVAHPIQHASLFVDNESL